VGFFDSMKPFEIIRDFQKDEEEGFNLISHGFDKKMERAADFFLEM